mmetsp:Transcript_2577/g.3574  ORF Transcript_2577/g.3574 Transcript_2577/m.3574 type:complete len:170 (-) Transcript_2577:92-601(-)
MCFNYRLSWHYHFGRLVFALTLVYFGYNILTQGRDFYLPYLHGLRRLTMPTSKNRISPTLTYEDVFTIVLQVVGALFISAGALIAVNKRVFGGVVALLAVGFLLVTQDNPLLVEYLKPKPKSGTIRYDDLARHITLIGAILFFMVVPPVDDPVEEESSKKKKKNKSKDD